MDFYTIMESESKKNGLEIYPGFQAIRSKYLMVRGGNFYAIWDDENGLWSTDEYSVVDIVDKDLWAHYEELKVKKPYLERVSIKTMRSFDSNSFLNFVRYTKTISDNFKSLDNKLTFANTEVKREDHVSKKLDYMLKEGDYASWNELIGTLYTAGERQKIEWAIGSIISGDSRNIQKFLVLYGDPGSGKGTILDIIQKLFKGYYTTFDAKSLGGNNNQFATEVFRSNPLVAIQHDGDLSRIEDNTKLNSIISHEEMALNEKYKQTYTGKMNAFLFMGTNKPVKISDSRSGIIRRLIDVSPSGEKIPEKHYHILKDRVNFELGAIAYHCLEVYRGMGKDYYSNYRPHSMMEKTDGFYNFVEENYLLFKKQDGVTLKHAYDIYKEYCEESSMPYKMLKYKFKEELSSYFKHYSKDTTHNGERVRNYFHEFKYDKFQANEEPPEEHALSLVLDETESLLDEVCKDYTSQYANQYERPTKKWVKIETTLKDLDTNKLHYVKLPGNHIVIDFDIKDAEGNKSFDLNVEAASKWPPTYAEVSKGGNGIHLHYIYEGNAEKLSRLYSKDIEVKVSVGNSSLRRRLTRCNNIEIATINSGLPLKGEKMLNFNGIKDERGLRKIIEKTLRKEVHPGTKPNIDFIHKILDDAYNAGIPYDVSDLHNHILIFATNSTNQAEYCIKLVQEMQFKSSEIIEGVDNIDDDKLVFYDVEVFPNLIVIVWKYKDIDKYVRMINPSAEDVAALMKMNLIGFNCRRYDNHILYAIYTGYTTEQVYRLSQRIIHNEKNTMFGAAYNISYVDIHDYVIKKQSLKKWEVELGINHQEMHALWDIEEGEDVWSTPVPEEHWDYVAEYCENDVMATEELFNATESEYIGRLIIAELSDLLVNDTTQRHSARIIFGKDRNPQSKFKYPNLAEEFPGYKFERGKSTYRGLDPSEGGYVWAKPGMYGNVGLLDIESMHPNSAIIMKVFGEYTKNYEKLMNSRLAIKHGDINLGKKAIAQLLNATRGIEVDEALIMIETILDKFNVEEDKLSLALKIVINIVYGMTSAKFPNPFKDPRNIDNVVAKRGALFMIDLLHACQEKAIEVVHIKTDSIKIADMTDEIKSFIFDFGAKYGYTFAHEATYDKFCLVNKAVYIAKYAWAEKEYKIGTWEATGAQFAHPYTYKSLFSKEPIEFADLCETKETKSKIFLDFNEHLVDEEMVMLEKRAAKLQTAINKGKKTDAGEKGYMSPIEINSAELEKEAILEILKEYHDYNPIGRVGSFCPVKEDTAGGILVRSSDTGYHAVTGTKGFRWKDSEVIKEFGLEDEIDYSYFGLLVDKAVKAIDTYGDFEWFVSEQPYSKEDNEIYPF